MRNRNQCLHFDTLGDQLYRWYRTPLGTSVAEMEQEILDRILPDMFGYHLLQIGVGDHSLFSASRILHKVVMAVGHNDREAQVELKGDPVALPLLSDSIDALVLHHTLEFARDPRQVLREVERVLVPEGHLLILGFNPTSFWGIRSFLGFRSHAVPWCGRFITTLRIKDWLALLGFEIQSMDYLYFRPPIQRAGISHQLRFLESWGKHFWPILGGVYVIAARKKVSTVTPIKPRWRPRRSLVSGLRDAASRSYERNGQN